MEAKGERDLDRNRLRVGEELLYRGGDLPRGGEEERSRRYGLRDLLVLLGLMAAGAVLIVELLL